jgi:hypothetical protein
MKTPREILLAQHQAANPKLDAIRHSTIATFNHQKTRVWVERATSPSQRATCPLLSVSWFLSCSKKIWTELIFPSRAIWAGLAAVWVVILAVNYSMRDHSQPQMAKTSPQMVLAFRQQEQLLTELIGPNDPPVTEPAKPTLPRPTSLRHTEIFTT